MLFLSLFLTAIYGFKLKSPAKKYLVAVGGLLSAFYLMLILLYYLE